MKDKIIHFKFGRFLTSSFYSFLIISSFWLLCLLLEKLSCPFPKIELGKFYDLAFFALSNFGFITFLSIIPFQVAEAKLSPGFYGRVLGSPWSHLGMYILMMIALACFFVLAFCETYQMEKVLNSLFMAMILSWIFAVLFHRFHTLRYIYQPTIVYGNIKDLAKEESFSDLWLDLYECLLKAIKESRISDARYFFSLMAHLYTNILRKDQSELASLQKDIQSLYHLARDQHPLTSVMEKNWPFLLDGTHQEELI